MNISSWGELARQVGFNGALVFAYTAIGSRFLNRLLNSFDNMHKEQQEHTKILNQLLGAAQKNGKQL